MTLVLGWIVLPLLLSVLSLGCGLLLEIASGMRLPGTLLLPGGFIVMSLAVYFAHMTDATATLQTPLVVGLAVGGYAASRPWHRFQIDHWLTGAAVGVYAVFAAPIVLFGPTFAGYIKLDDTAAYMAMLDRAQSHAYNVSGLDYSTYLRVLQEGYVFGYPLGSFLPLDIGRTLLGVDPLWLWQPYLTFLTVLIALGLYQLVSGNSSDVAGGSDGPDGPGGSGGVGAFVKSRALRACIAFFGAQAALLYGYAMWGGVKELFSPGVLLFAACLVPRLRTGTPRQVIPLAAASAALIGGLSVGGGVWLVPCIVGGVVLLVLTRTGEDVLKTIGVYAITAGVLAIPILSVSLRRLSHISKFTKATGGEIGNLLHPLSLWQAGGIWPSNDFRSPPSDMVLTQLLVAVVVIAALFAVVIAWRRRRWEIVIILATAVFSLLVYVGGAVPWVAGKSLASSSPLILALGFTGAAIVFETGRRVEGGLVLVALAAAVLWSNFLQYQGVFYGPSARLMELQTIGDKFGGHGGFALMNEYEPYGARHFLRSLNVEGAAELRVDYVYLYPKDCPSSQKLCWAPSGASPDIDRIGQYQGKDPQTGKAKTLEDIFGTIVTRRSGSESRPPSAYHLVWSGHYYDVWQERFSDPRIVEHVPLGSQYQPAAIPPCSTVMRVAHVAAAKHGLVAAVIRPRVKVLPVFARATTSPYTFGAPFHVLAFGAYDVWVGGSFSSTLTVTLDGRVLGQGRNEQEWPGNFLYFGTATLKKGAHDLKIHHSGPDWGPGSAALQPFGIGFGLGPVVIAPTPPQGTDDYAITKVAPSKARSLCGKSLDWIEALAGS